MSNPCDAALDIRYNVKDEQELYHLQRAMRTFTQKCAITADEVRLPATVQRKLNGNSFVVEIVIDDIIRGVVDRETDRPIPVVIGKQNSQEYNLGSDKYRFVQA